VKKTLNEIAVFLDGSVIGDGGVVIEQIRGIDDAGEGDLTFVANPKYLKKLDTTGASAILVAPETVCPGKNLLIVADPYIAMGRLLALFHPEEEETAGIRAGAWIEAGADVPDGSRGERRDRPAHAPARRRMSFSTPAAVTSAPAPGPRITRGFAL